MPNWKKVIVSGSEASLLNLIVDNNVTASFFTGSFKGDGSQLINLNADDGLPDNNWDFNIPDYTPINDFQTASTDYLIDFRNEQLVGDPAGLIAWFGNAAGDTQLLPTNNGLIIIADDEQQGLVTSAGYSGSIVGIGNVMNYSQSVDDRLNSLQSATSSLDSRLDVLESYSSSQQVPTSSYAFTASEARNVVLIARNQNASTLPAGTIVHIVDAVGDNPIFDTASYDNEALSSNSLGVLRNSAASGADVEVLVNGIVVGVNTNPALGYIAGDIIYLSSSGQFTRNKPQAPKQTVTIGQVLRAQQNNGSIYVNISNGWEVGELHDVIDNTTNSSYGELLVKSGSLWKSTNQLTGSYSITGSLKFNGNGSMITLPNHSSAPSSPQSGSLYFNTTDFHFYGWNGNSWKQLDN